MSDDHLLTLLRDVTVDPAPATPGNLRGAAALGKRMRRRRRAATALGSGLTVAGFAALLTLASPGRQTVIQGATPPTSPPNAATDLTAHDVNVNLLRQALGPTAWDLAYNREPDGPVRSGPLDLNTAASAGRGLPAGFVATTYVTVLPSKAQLGCATLSPGPRTVSCRIEKPAGGGTLELSRTMTANGGASEGAVSAETHIAYQRPDSLVLMWLAATGWSKNSAADQRTALAWLAAFDDRLTATATDARVRVEPSGTNIPVPGVDPLVNMAAARSDDQRMLAHLGPADGWAMVYENDSTAQGEGVAPLPGSAAATGVPDDWTVDGSAQLDTGDSCGDGKGTMRCSTETTPDGKTVQVLRTDFPRTESSGGDRIQVMFGRPDGSQVDVSLAANWKPGGGTAASQQQAQTWLTSQLPKLIATAEDPALTADRYQTTCCGG